MTVKADGHAAGRIHSRAGTAELLSRADRVARGKDARDVAPLESHAEFVPDVSRDPVGLLLGQAADLGRCCPVWLTPLIMLCVEGHLRGVGAW